jgi:hypothetical protein
MVALLLTWAAFGFSIGRTPLAPFPLPAPDYWIGFWVQQSTAAGRIFIAFDRLWTGTQWWYFPLNFVIRNPLPLLVVLLVGGWLFVRFRARRLDNLALLVFPLLYTALALGWGMNVGYRHMLPVRPFLYLIAASGLAHLWNAGFQPAYSRMWWRRAGSPRSVLHAPGREGGLEARVPFLRFRSVLLLVVGGVLGVWYVAGTLRVFPDELTFFNELVGGPEGGYRYLVDYSQDWGQAYKELRDYVGAHPGPDPQVFTFTNVQPDDYGVAFQPLDRTTPFHPQPGRYVLGPPPLYGLVGPNPLEFDWFRRAEPTAMVGHSLFVYDLTDEPDWVAQCTVPAVPLDDAALAAGFGADDLRRVDFDCTSAWLYRDDRDTLGVYALHHALLEERRCGLFGLLPCDPAPADPFVARRLAGARLSYEQPEFSLLPAFALYEWQGGPPLPSSSQQVRAAPAGVPLPDLASRPLITAPVPFAGPLTFLGAAGYRDGAAFEVETWWRVTAGPTTRPFSIMAHLLTEDGVALGVADGLGISPSWLAVGDVIVQRHRFPALPEQGEIWLRTGAYWLDTMERWPLQGTPENDALFDLLRSDE